MEINITERVIGKEMAMGDSTNIPIISTLMKLAGTAKKMASKNLDFIPEDYQNLDTYISLIRENKPQLEKYGTVPDTFHNKSFQEVEKAGLRDSALAFIVNLTGLISPNPYKLFLKIYHPSFYGDLIDNARFNENLASAKEKAEMEIYFMRFANHLGFPMPVYMDYREIGEKNNEIICAVMSYIDGFSVDKVMVKNRISARPLEKMLKIDKISRQGEYPEGIKEMKTDLEGLLQERKEIVDSMLNTINEIAINGSRSLEKPKYRVEENLKELLEHNQFKWNAQSMYDKMREYVEAAVVWEIASQQGFSKEIIDDIRVSGIKKMADRENKRKITRMRRKKELKENAWTIPNYINGLDWLTKPDLEGKNTWCLADKRFYYLVQGDEYTHNFKLQNGQNKRKTILLDGDRARLGRVELSKARVLFDPYLELAPRDIKRFFFDSLDDAEQHGGLNREEDMRSDDKKYRDFCIAGVYALIGAIGLRAKYLFEGSRLTNQDRGPLTPSDDIPKLQKILRRTIDTVLEYDLPRDTREKINYLMQVNKASPYKLFSRESPKEGDIF